jgi:hypothetical protein
VWLRLGRGRYELLVDQCMRNVAVFGGVFSQIDPAKAVDPDL